MSFADLKRRKNSISKLVSAAEAVGGEKKNYNDDRVWKPSRDKAGNGYAVIRFLPAAEGNDLPWNRYWDHGFQGPTGQWYIEKSLTSINQDDPVGKLNGTLWNSGIESNKEKARVQKRRLHYVANVMVINDSANPENNGQVKIYQFGKKIFDMIMDAMQPQYDDEEPLNPFDFWEGANFKIKIRNVEGWVNYDKSEFDKSSALSDDDEELEKIYNSLHDLREFTDPKNYKSYEELEERLNVVLGNQAVTSARDTVSLDEQEAPSLQRKEYAETVSVSDDADEEEDTLSYFAKLAQED